MIEIRNHRAVGATWQPSLNVGGTMEPQLIVLHETASHLTNGNAASWLCDKKSGVSAHFVVERDGSIRQLVPCDVVAWHCDPSEWQGRRKVNGFSIGIEIVGPGRLTPRGDVAVAWFGGKTSWPLAECVMGSHPNQTRNAVWLPFTDAQIAAVHDLVAGLLAAYPRIADVVGHYEIAVPAGRKEDPAPCFPIASVRALCAGRVAPSKEMVEQAQARLLVLGYDTRGVDGILGPATRTAIRGFQDRNGLPNTGELDAATRARLDAPAPEQMTTGTRTETTKADVASVETFVVKRTSEVKGVEEAINAVNQLSDALSHANKAKSTGDQLTTVLGWLTSPAGLRSVFVLGTCAFAWWAANKIDWQRVRDRVRGLTTRST